MLELFHESLYTYLYLSHIYLCTYSLRPSLLTPPQSKPFPSIPLDSDNIAITRIGNASLNHARSHRKRKRVDAITSS